MQKAAQSKQNDAFYAIHSFPTIFVSQSEEYNKQYAIEHNINVCHSYNMGGTIVANAGDIDIAIFYINGWEIGSKILELIRQYLIQFLPNISICNNDLLLEYKYKMASYASINCGDNMIYTAIHISNNPNIELIKNICTKPMRKIPQGVGEHGININNILEVISNNLPTMQ